MGMPVSRLCGLLLICASLLGGCPNNPPSNTGSVDARIAASTTQGAPPLRIVFSGQESTSKNGAIDRYAWDIGGLAESSDATVDFLFTTPGFFPVTLTAFDETGASAIARINVRIAGGPVSAAIQASLTSGIAPLGVLFDGSASTAQGDVIRDYFWDFGDGATARSPAPAHTFATPGVYTVRLRAVSGGGVEGAAEVTIHADAPDPSGGGP